MVLGVKYCGGCNPRFARAAVVERLQAEFPALQVVYMGREGDAKPDYTLVINGCSARCAAAGVPPGPQGQFVLSAEEDYPRLAAGLHALLDDAT